MVLVDLENIWIMNMNTFDVLPGYHTIWQAADTYRNEYNEEIFLISLDLCVQFGSMLH